MTWHPIETAPKDGSLIDLWISEQNYRIPDCRWLEPPIRGYVAPDAKLPGWFSPSVHDQCGDMHEIAGATHWMHRPTGPE